MKIKTSVLVGPALDFAILKTLFGNGGPDWGIVDGVFGTISLRDVRVGMDGMGQEEVFHPFRPSTDWAHGGPLIEKFCSRLSTNGDRSGPDPDTGEGFYEDLFVWSACAGFSGGYGQAKTALIAAMRAIVSSKLGNEVDIPEELCKP